MKKLVLAVMAVCLVTGFALAQETQAPAPDVSPAAAVAPESVTIEGDIIDNMCADSQKPEALAAFVSTHTKQCALMPDCEASGYSIYSDGALTKFDAESSAKVAEFLKKEDSKLQVVVVASKTGDELSLVSIENQK